MMKIKKCIPLILLIGISYSTMNHAAQRTSKSPPRAKLELHQQLYRSVSNSLIRAQVAFVKTFNATSSSRVCKIVKNYVALTREIPSVVLNVVSNCLVKQVSNLQNYLTTTLLPLQDRLCRAMGFRDPPQVFTEKEKQTISLELQTQHYENESRMQKTEFSIDVREGCLQFNNETKQAYEAELAIAEANYKAGVFDTTPRPLLEAEIVKLQSFLKSKEAFEKIWQYLKKEVISLGICEEATFEHIEQILPSYVELTCACEAELARLQPLVEYGKQCREQQNGVSSASSAVSLPKASGVASDEQKTSSQGAGTQALFKSHAQEDSSHADEALVAQTLDQVSIANDVQVSKPVGCTEHRDTIEALIAGISFENVLSPEAQEVLGKYYKWLEKQQDKIFAEYQNSLSGNTTLLEEKLRDTGKGLEKCPCSLHAKNREVPRDCWSLKDYINKTISALKNIHKLFAQERFSESSGWDRIGAYWDALFSENVIPDRQFDTRDKVIALMSSGFHGTRDLQELTEVVEKDIRQCLGEYAQAIFKTYLQDPAIAQMDYPMAQLDQEFAELLQIYQSDPTKFIHDVKVNSRVIAYFKLEGFGEALKDQRMQQLGATYFISGQANSQLCEYGKSLRDKNAGMLKSDIQVMLFNRFNAVECIELLEKHLSEINKYLGVVNEQINNCKDISTLNRLLQEKNQLEIVRSYALTLKAESISNIIFCEDAIKAIDYRLYFCKEEQKRKTNLVGNVAGVAAMAIYGIGKDLINDGIVQRQGLENHIKLTQHCISLGDLSTLASDPMFQKMESFKQTYPMSAVDVAVKQCEDVFVNRNIEDFNIARYSTNNGIFLENAIVKLQNFVASSAAKDQAEITIATQRIDAIQNTIATQGQQTTIAIPAEVQKLLSHVSPALSEGQLTGNAFQHQLYGEIGELLHEIVGIPKELGDKLQTAYLDAAQDFSVAALEQTKAGNIETASALTDFAQFLLKKTKQDIATGASIGFGVVKGIAKGGISPITSIIQFITHPVEAGKPLADLFNRFSIDPEGTLVTMFGELRNQPVEKQAEFLAELTTSLIVNHKLPPLLGKAFTRLSFVVEAEIAALEAEYSATQGASLTPVKTAALQNIRTGAGATYNAEQATASAVSRVVETERKLGQAAQAVQQASGREKILPKVATYEQARNKALEIIGEVDPATSKPYIGKFGVCRGKVVGRSWHKRKVVLRLDYDSVKGPHINATDYRLGDGMKGTSVAIPFEGTEETVETLLKHLQ